MNSFLKGFGLVGEGVGPARSTGGVELAIALRTLVRSIEPKSVTVPVEVPLLAVVQLVGASPTPHSSFQLKLPPLAKRERARPVISIELPVTGAYQSGESIATSGGILPLCASATAAPRFTRPHPKCVVHWSIEGFVGSAPGSGTPSPSVFGVKTRSAVCSRISRVSSGRSVTAGLASRAALTTSPAAPAALPVFSEPVEPSIEIELLPPY